VGVDIWGKGRAVYTLADGQAANSVVSKQLGECHCPLRLLWFMALPGNLCGTVPG